MTNYVLSISIAVIGLISGWVFGFLKLRAKSSPHPDSARLLKRLREADPLCRQPG